MFEAHTRKLVEEARREGVPEEEIAEITAAGEKLPQLTKAVTGAYRPLTRAA